MAASRARLLRALLLLVLAGAVIFAAAATWLASESGLRWALARIAAAANGALSIEQVGGSALGSMRLGRVAYVDGDTRIEARDVVLTVGWRNLWSRQLSIPTLEVANLLVRMRGKDAAVMPASLALPIEVAIGAARLARVEVDAGGRTPLLGEVRFAYAGGPGGHHIRELAAVTPWGPLQGSGRIDTRRPFALDAQGTLQAATPAGPAEFGARLTGDLARIDIALKGAGAGATLGGQIALVPFNAVVLDTLDLTGRAIDLARLRDGWPKTTFSVAIKAAGGAGGTVAGRLVLTGEAAGALDAGKLPLASLEVGFATAGAAVELREIDARLVGAGRVSGRAHLSESGVDLDLALTALDLRALDSRLVPTRLAGSLRGRAGVAGQDFDLDLRDAGTRMTARLSQAAGVLRLPAFTVARGGAEVRGEGEVVLSGAYPFKARTRFRNLDPAAFGSFPSARLNGDAGFDGVLAPAWRVDVKLDAAGRWREAPLRAEVSGRLAAGRVSDMRAQIAAGANTLALDGGFGSAGDAMHFTLDAGRLGQLDPMFSGALNAKGSIGGSLALPRVSVTGSAHALRVRDRIETGQASFDVDAAAATTAPLKLTLAASALALAGTRFEQLQVNVTGSAGRHAGELALRGGGLDLNARVAGSWSAAPVAAAERVDPGRWSGRIESLRNAGVPAMRLAAPVTLELSRDRLVLGQATLELEQGRARVDHLLLASGRLSTAGDFSGVPVAPLLPLLGQAGVLATDLVLGGRWNLVSDPELRGELRIARERGDLRLLKPAPLALGLARLETQVLFEARRATATLVAESPTTGRVSGTALLEPAGVGMLESLSGLPAQSRLALHLKAALGSLRVLNPLIGNVALIDGALDLELNRDGTLADPSISGTVTGARLKVDAPQYGLALGNGHLRARFDERELVVEEFTLAAREGRFSAQGSVMTAAGAKSRLTWRADKLALLNRPDMRIVLDGSGSVSREGERALLEGAVRIVEGAIDFGRPSGPQLGDDVVVDGRGRRAQPEARRSRLLGVDLQVDFGTRFQVRGRGLDARLGGQLRVRSAPDGALTARGTLETRQGTYTAFGQDLEIERGRLVFDGALDNPTLDVRALRRHLAVEAGIEVTGNLALPRVRLVSDPPVSDSEKIAWLTLGRGLDSATKADAGLLQAAASALLSSGDAVPVTRRIASAFGLDSLGVRGGAAQDQVLALGKRLSDRLYLAYEQGVGIASSVIRIDYALRRGLTLRAEAGTTAGFGVFFSRSFD